ncbi:MAG: 30S ribosomal protein S12 methylthiotransferase RimO [Candidatus Ancaeobacter aquaticus]|nr:30S ribosomal protein S12 methylthiotransferase RimO [Candidatus Ancaeobacter aquaticus]
MYAVSMVSLGCSKNLVDSEVMLGLLAQAGYTLTSDLHSSDIIIVNTCSFIESAQEESRETILSMKHFYTAGKIIVVTGCFSKLYKKELSDAIEKKDRQKNQFSELINSVHAFLGPGDISRIHEVIDAIVTQKPFHMPKVLVEDNPAYIYDHSTPRARTTPPHTAYVKIAEGCANNCTYCLIPSIRGAYRSRTIDSIVEEVKILADHGVVEVSLIAQDTTCYGKDTYGKHMLPELLEALATRTQICWIRVLYTHPAHFTKELVNVIRDIPQVCKYVDLPIQHIDDAILKAMGRRVSSRDIYTLIDSVRNAIPHVTLRTSVIVGFPGETDRQFMNLLDCVKDIRFERLGAFTYSREKGTSAYTMPDQVSREIKEIRLHAIMSMQQVISKEKNKQLINTVVPVLVDGLEGKGKYFGRTQADALDVDCLVHVKGKNITPGSFVDMHVKSASEYDIEGTMISKKVKVKPDNRQQTRDHRLKIKGKSKK